MTNKEFYTMITQSFYHLLDHVENVTKWGKKEHDFVHEPFTPIDIHLAQEQNVKQHYSMFSYDFHIKELPGWLFGVWIYKPTAKTGCYDGKGNVKYVKGTWFCAYEKFVGKFKPSRTHFSGDFYVEQFGNKIYRADSYPNSDIVDAMKFIKKNKYVAYYFDSSFLGVYQHVSKLKAKRQYNKDHFNNWVEETRTKILDKKVLKIYAKYCFYDLKNAYFYDYEDHRSPRYQMMCPLKGNDLIWTDGKGIYTYNDEFLAHLEKKVNKVKRLAKLLGDSYYMTPVANDVEVV